MGLLQKYLLKLLVRHSRKGSTYGRRVNKFLGHPSVFWLHTIFNIYIYHEIYIFYVTNEIMNILKRGHDLIFGVK